MSTITNMTTARNWCCIWQI